MCEITYNINYTQWLVPYNLVFVSKEVLYYSLRYLYQTLKKKSKQIIVIYICISRVVTCRFRSVSEFLGIDNCNYKIDTKRLMFVNLYDTDNTHQLPYRITQYGNRSIIKSFRRQHAIHKCFKPVIKHISPIMISVQSNFSSNIASLE